MKVKIELDLKAFKTPNFVLVCTSPTERQEGIKEEMKFNLTELDSLTLSELCDQFREDIFKKAGKEQPPQSV